MNKVAIVTGGSGGIGRCTAAALKNAGCIVYEFSRRDIPAEGIIHISADVTDAAGTAAAVAGGRPGGADRHPDQQRGLRHLRGR